MPSLCYKVAISNAIMEPVVTLSMDTSSLVSIHPYSFILVVTCYTDENLTTEHTRPGLLSMASE